jgi:hypothetical protein
MEVPTTTAAFVLAEVKLALATAKQAVDADNSKIFLPAMMAYQKAAGILESTAQHVPESHRDRLMQQVVFSGTFRVFVFDSISLQAKL